jgi:metal-sulfur cluster biosynthetic enzyme
MNSETLTLKERVIESLKGIFDPEIPVNIYDLGLIYSLEVKEDTEEQQDYLLPAAVTRKAISNAHVTIHMTLTSPACPVAQTFPQTVQDTVLKLPGVGNVMVELVWDPPWTQERMSEVAKLQLNLF